MTELTLSAFDVSDPFRVFSADEYGCEVDSIESDSATVDCYWNVALAFPSLTKLVVKRSEITLFWCPLPSVFYEVLPPTITQLELDGSTKQHCKLPASLHTLHIGWIKLDNKWPSSLTHLDVKWHHREQEQELVGLTPQVLRLSIWDLKGINCSKVTILSVPHSYLKARDLLALPSTLTHLEAYQVKSRTIEAHLQGLKDVNYDLFWPRNLRVWRFMDHSGFMGLFPARQLIEPLIRALPSTVTHLQGLDSLESASLDWDTLALQFPQLETFTLRHITEGTTCRLPSTLKSFKVTDLESLSFGFLRSSSLTSLALYYQSYGTGPYTDCSDSLAIFRRISRISKSSRMATPAHLVTSLTHVRYCQGRFVVSSCALTVRFLHRRFCRIFRLI